MTSQSNSQVSVTIDGDPWGAWDTLSGGATTSSPSKRRPGGTRREKVSRGRSTTDDLTVGKEFEKEDVGRVRQLRARVHRAQVVVTEQLLDDDDVPFGQPTTYTGVLSSVSTGDVDSDSDDFRMCEIGVVVEAVS